MYGCSDSVFANWSGVSFPTIPSCPGTHISLTLPGGWRSGRRVGLTTLPLSMTRLSKKCGSLDL
jgi:hypothetical protein